MNSITPDIGAIYFGDNGILYLVTIRADLKVMISVSSHSTMSFGFENSVNLLKDMDFIGYL